MRTFYNPSVLSTDDQRRIIEMLDSVRDAVCDIFEYRHNALHNYAPRLTSEHRLERQKLDLQRERLSELEKAEEEGEDGLF